jgi:4-hydroxy-3-methylbut-2-enyl diphosphate reductase
MERARTRFPDLWMPGRSDLCYATTNRQGALRAIAAKADAMVVIGSANSSNTVSLAKVASAEGCPRVLRVDRASELPGDLSGTVGVTAGASAPEWLVDEVLERLAPRDGIEVVDVTVEDEYFPPPPELRELLRCAALAAEVALGAGSHPSPLSDDRDVPASRMLAAS